MARTKSTAPAARSRQSRHLIGRRDVLRGAAQLGASACVGQWLIGCGAGARSLFGEVPLDLQTFRHGVASGDPLADAIILWTRVTTAESGTVEVDWEVSRDELFTDVVAAGTTTTDASRDHTIKVDALGLQPDNHYYYRFIYLEGASPIGRARTAPTGRLDSIKFGVASCANLNRGYFHAYRRMAAHDDLDFVLHLGDYIYEYGNGAREHEPPHEAVTLDDYRTRYAQYRRDPDLQLLHQRFPFVTVWDDHETANNAWSGGAENHQPDTEGTWSDRQMAAAQAYYEWLPIRENPLGTLYRRLQFGDLLDLIMLDTRIAGRQQQGGTLIFEPSDPSLPSDLLGAAQESWLQEQLLQSTAQWKVLGQQVIMGLWKVGDSYANDDQWNGYPAARRRLLSFIRDNQIDNVIVLTGDVHSSWAMDVTDDDVPYDPETGEGAMAVEFVTPGITSPGDVALSALASGLLMTNPHIKYFEGDHRGYMLIDLNSTRARASWHFVDGIDEAQGEEIAGPIYETQSGVSNARLV